MRLLGMMITRNEADRFLGRSLASLVAICSDVAVFDDRSTDGTIGLLEIAGVHHDQRQEHQPSFADNEGQFRDMAWGFMEWVLHPEPGDWIVALDADEVVVVDDPPNLAGHLAETDSEALTVKIHELWQLVPPMQRVDGYWGGITGLRLYRWRPGQHIATRELASGSVPPVTRLGTGQTDTLRIAHLGYVRREDREAKHARYSNRRGHSTAHVASILAKPTLAPLPGGLPR